MQRRLAKLVLFGISALALATVQPLWGQQPAGQVRKLTQSPSANVYEDTQWSPDQDIQLLKSNIRSQKKQIIAANMDLTDAEAEKFWPVYDRYSADLGKIQDTKPAAVGETADRYQPMNGNDAESYIRRQADVEESVAQLRLRYVPEFRKVLSGRQAVLFFQIDW